MKKTSKEVQTEMIAAAVLWWTQKLSGAPQGLPGDRESFGSLLALYVSAISGQNDLEKESQVKFAETLEKYLVEESSGKNRSRINLGTDYGPEYPLSEICSKSGVSGARFPNKTDMNLDFEDGTVTWSTVRGPRGQIYPVVSTGK